MIDVIFSIIDRLAKLKSFLDAKGREAFEEILAPTFADLERVHKNYLELFDQVDQQLPSFEFLAKPGSNWLGEHNYVNFDSEADALRFLELEGRKDDKLHVALCAKGYYVDYPVPGDQPPIAVIFHDKWNADEAARRVGAGPVRTMPPPTVPEGVYPAMRNLVAFVRQKRLEYEPVRVRLKALGRVLAEVPLGLKGDHFIKTVLAYFPDGSLKPFYGPGEQDVYELREKHFSSGATSVLEALKDIEKPGAADNADLLNKSAAEARYLIFWLQTIQKEQWERVSDAFAKLQAERLRLW